MAGYKKIVAVVGRDVDAMAVLQKALQLLRDDDGASLRVVRTVYQGIAELDASAADESERFRRIVLETETAALRDAVAANDARLANVECAALWGPRSWETVLQEVERVDADLVVKAEARGSEPRWLRAPDDWNLLRHSKVPVLLCDTRGWSPVPRLLAAVDAFDDAHESLNSRVLSSAADLRSKLGGKLDLVCAYPSLEPWIDQLDVLRSYKGMVDEVARAASTRLDALLQAHGQASCSAHAVAGLPEQVITSLARRISADIVVLGTKARRGLEGALVGNTAEKIVHDLAVDVLTVP